MSYNGKYGSGNGYVTPNTGVSPQPVNTRYGNRPAPEQVRPAVNKQTSTGRYSKDSTVKKEAVKKVSILRDLEATRLDLTLVSTLNALHINVDKYGEELSNTIIHFKEMYSLVGTKEECRVELECILTHIEKIKIVDNPEFVGTVSPFIDFIVSNLINIEFKNVRFKNVVNNINILLTLNDRDDVIWERLSKAIHNVINDMTDHSLTVQVPLLVVDDSTWSAALTKSLETEVEYDIPMYDGMYYIFIDGLVLRAIGNKVNIIKG